MGVANVPAASAAGLQPKYQKFTSSGTFTLPTGYGAGKPLLVTLQVFGGGGGGAMDTFSMGGASVMRRDDYFGQSNYNFNAGSYTVRGAGGSGGLASTQLYLTENLTITVGAAGTRSNSTNRSNNIGNNYSLNTTGPNGTAQTWIEYASGSAVTNGGTGGLTSAGNTVKATGGAGGNIGGTFAIQNGWSFDATAGFGAGGTPAGTTGAAVPLLGTVAGGSSTTTPVYGSYGVGGIYGDATTSTGVEGTGGGGTSVGAPGAVILTWWE
jgi:hypothetical protein